MRPVSPSRLDGARTAGISLRVESTSSCPRTTLDVVLERGVPSSCTRGRDHFEYAAQVGFPCKAISERFLVAGARSRSIDAYGVVQIVGLSCRRGRCSEGGDQRASGRRAAWKGSRTAPIGSSCTKSSRAANSANDNAPRWSRQERAATSIASTVPQGIRPHAPALRGPRSTLSPRRCSRRRLNYQPPVPVIATERCATFQCAGISTRLIAPQDAAIAQYETAEVTP